MNAVQRTHNRTHGKEHAHMLRFDRRAFGGWLLAVLIAGTIILGTRYAQAIDPGDQAPDFKLPSTTGLDIALADFKGKKWVFLEFYALDFSPA